MTLYRHQCIMRQKFFRYRFFIIPCLLLAFALAWLIVRAFPASENDIRRSSCYVNGRSELCLFAHGDTLVLASDSVHIQGVWINRHWWWPSCAVNYIVFSVTTLYYAGYLLLIVYYVFALHSYIRHRVRYTCGNCGATLHHKGRCPHCGAENE